MKSLNAASILPEEGTTGTLVGRGWLPSASGPSVVAVRSDGVFDVTSVFSTVSALVEHSNPAGALQAVPGTRIASLDHLIANTLPDGRDSAKPWLLAPLDHRPLGGQSVQRMAPPPRQRRTPRETEYQSQRTIKPAKGGAAHEAGNPVGDEQQHREAGQEQDGVGDGLA